MDISEEIAAIQAASEGSELRQPIIDILNKINSSGTLPSVSASDVGKLLKVGVNGWELGNKSDYMPVPTATKQITENGTYNVTDFANAIVSVSGSGGIDILSGIDTPSVNIGIDGQIYLQYGFEDFSSFSKKKESSMNVYINSDDITFDYLGGAYIGAQAYKQYDLTDIDEIYFSITSGHHSYNNYQTEKFSPLVVIENTVNPANLFVANNISPVPGSKISTDDTTISLTVDVSGYTGNYWIVFCSYGCDSTVNALRVGEDSTTISKSYCKVNGIWQDLKGSDIGDVNLGT